MKYPLVLAYNGDEFARINHDGSWSVNWEKAINVRYQPSTLTSQAIISCAIVLLAARDNFFLTPWDEFDANGDKWTHKTRVYDVMSEEELEGEKMLCRVGPKEDPFAKVNLDGTWSIKWGRVEELSRLPLDNRNTIALVGFCRLLKAAQYRFQTTPWQDIEDDEE